MKAHAGQACAVAAVIAVLSSLPQRAARADVVILSSKTASLPRGAVLKDSDQLEVPAGSSLTVMLPSGATRTINGPARTPVRDLVRGEPDNQALWDGVKEFINGSGSAKSTGAVRALRIEPELPFSWRQVPVEVDGDICVEKGAPLMLARASGAKSVRATIVDIQAGARADVRFEDGKTTVPWPEQIPPKVGTFAVVMQDRPMRQITLRLINPLPQADQVLRLLHGQRCQLQLEAWLRNVAK